MTARGNPLLRLLLALVLAAALAGCGGDDEADEVAPEENAVSEAAATTVAAGTSALEYEATFDGPEGSYAFSAEGEVDFEQFRAHLSYDLTEVGEGQDNADVLIDGTTVLVRFPDGAEGFELPEGVEWIRLPAPEAPAVGDPGEEEEDLPAEAPDVGGIQQDPTQFLRYLQTGAVEVQEEGTEELRGEETTIYTALIDLDRVVEQGGETLGRDQGDQEASLRAAEALREQLGDAGIPVTVNVDEEGRIRRLLLSLDILGAHGVRVSALTVTDFFDFGTEVDVAPPPEEQVIDAADVG